MMSRHFALSSELRGAIAKILPHAKNQLSVASSFFNQFATDIYTMESVYNGHPRDWTKLDRWPLYTGDCFNPQRYQRSAINIKLLEIHYLK